MNTDGEVCLWGQENCLKKTIYEPSHAMFRLRLGFNSIGERCGQHVDNGIVLQVIGIDD